MMAISVVRFSGSDKVYHLLWSDGIFCVTKLRLHNSMVLILFHCDCGLIAHHCSIKSPAGHGNFWFEVWSRSLK